MTGRSSGAGRGGKGHNNNKSLKEGQVSKKKKKTLTDYQYNLGSASQASEYDDTTQYLINYIKRTCDNGQDIARALETLQCLNA